MFIENLTNFIRNYGKGRKIKLVGFAILSFFAGCLEFVGVALIYPFIMLIIQPESIYLSKYIKIENSVRSGLLIGLCMLLVFIFKNTYIILNQYIQNKFVIEWKNDLVTGFMRYFLFAPYKMTMKVSANDKLFILNTLCDQSIGNFVIRILNLATNVIILVMILMLLFVKYTIPAAITITFVCIALIVQNKYFKSRTSVIAELLAKQSKALQSSTLENITNIKEVKILSSEDVFYNKYKNVLDDLKRTSIIHSFYCAIPPYFIEILVVISLMLMAYILSIKYQGNNSELIASFAIIAAAIFRIAPALNRIQSNIIGINTSRNFVKLLNNEADKFNFTDFENTKNDKISKFNFEREICLKNVNFSYVPSKNVINNVSLTINKGDFIGIIGLSGAGKSTLADIITGLLPVDSGTIAVDGVELNNSNFPAFRRLIGYVPQQINILETSIRENIAWGCSEIDDKIVEKVLKESQIFDVIKDRPDSIYSDILTNGLSQGQKQRLAIARALYREPEILILDEATSALDVQVEHEITDMLSQISKKKTIIAIAHRLSTLKACNKLIYLKEGKIVDVGTFSELSDRYADFANLVKLSKIE